MDIKKLKDAHSALSAGRVAMSGLAAITSAAFVGAFTYDRVQGLFGNTASIVIAVLVSVLWAFVFDAGIYRLTPFIFNSLANFTSSTLKNGRRMVLLTGAILLLIGMSVSSIYTSMTAASVTVNMVTDKYVPVEAQKTDNSQVKFLQSQLATATASYNKASDLYNKTRKGTHQSYVANKDRIAFQKQMNKLTGQLEKASNRHARIQGERELRATQQNTQAVNNRNEQVEVFSSIYRYIGILSTVLFLFFSLCKELLEIEYPETKGETFEEEIEESPTPPIAHKTVKKPIKRAVSVEKQEPKVETVPRAEEVVAPQTQPHRVTVARNSPIGFATAGSEKRQVQSATEVLGEKRYQQIDEGLEDKTPQQLGNQLRARKSRMKKNGFTPEEYHICKMIIQRLAGYRRDVSMHAQEIEKMKKEYMNV